MVLIVEEERKNAAESDEPAERHCIEPAEPIGFRLPNHHRHVVPPVRIALGSLALSIVTHDEQKDRQTGDDWQSHPPKDVVPSARGRNAWRKKEYQHGADIARCDDSQHQPLMSSWIRTARQRQGHREARPADTKQERNEQQLGITMDAQPPP